MSLKEIKSQENFVVNELLKNGKISRNQCLQKYITRLGALIYIIKNKNPDWEISAKFEKINGGKDYVYYLDNRDEVKKGQMMRDKDKELMMKDINADLDSLANSALKQIEDMKYDTELNDFGVKDIVKIGIAFRQKSAVVKRG